MSTPERGARLIDSDLMGELVRLEQEFTDGCQMLEELTDAAVGDAADELTPEQAAELHDLAIKLFERTPRPNDTT